MAHTYDFTFAVDGLDPDLLRVLKFRGVEAMSEPFRYDLALCSLDPDVELADVVGKNAVLSWVAGDEPRVVHGIVSRFEFAGQGRKLTYYAARLVPRVWSLSLLRRSRIFQEMTTPDILKKVLTDGGMPADSFEISVQRSYKPRHFCVQYRETDFTFLSRLAEEEGIFYFFRHTEDKHVMVLADAASIHEPIPGDDLLPFMGEDGGGTGDEGVQRFTLRRAMRTGAVMLRDFDFKRPTLDLSSEKQADEEAEFEFYDYPGEFHDAAHAKTYAEIRLEEQRAEREVAHGRGTCRRFVAGHKFTLDRHPRDAFNAEYLLLSVTHTGEQPQAAEEDQTEGAANVQVYGNEFKVVAADVAWRPPRLTPRPVIDGVQTAVVTGPSGEEIHCDEHGRVKIKFHWDREGPKDDKSSYWVRVGQVQSVGSMMLPRVGWEVIVDFLEGDPDRPIIIGRLHNGADPGPYGLPGAKTRMSIQSASSPGGGNSNEIRFEDAGGSEELYIHASKDLVIKADHDTTQSFGNNAGYNVAVDSERNVGANCKTDIGGNCTIHVAGNHEETIDGNMTHTVSGNQDNTVSGNRSTNVSGSDSLMVSGKQGIQIGGAHEMKVGAASSEDIGSNKSVNAAAMMSFSAGAMMNLTAPAVAAEGGSSVTLASGGTMKIESSGAFKAKSGGAMLIEASGGVKVKAPKIVLEGSSQVIIKAGGSTIKVSGGGVDIKGSKVKINGSGGVNVKGAKVTNN